MDRSRVPLDAIPGTASDTAASVTLTISGVVGKRTVIFGFWGSALAQKVGVVLAFGGVTQLDIQGLADVNTGMDFGGIGLVAAENTDVTIVTTPAASALCKANVIYLEMAVVS